MQLFNQVDMVTEVKRMSVSALSSSAPYQVVHSVLIPDRQGRRMMLIRAHGVALEANGFLPCWICKEFDLHPEEPTVDE